MKLYQPPRSVLEKHYEDLSAKAFFPGMIDYMQSGPVCCMVWEGAGAVVTGRKMLGATKPRYYRLLTRSKFILILIMRVLINVNLLTLQ